MKIMNSIGYIKVIDSIQLIKSYAIGKMHGDRIVDGSIHAFN